MHKKDYIPEADNKFYEWVNHTFPYATDPTNINRWRLRPDIVSAALVNEYNEFKTNYLHAINPETRTPAAITAKTESKKKFESSFRSYIKSNITYNPDVTDEDRRIMQIPIHDTKPTHIGAPEEEGYLEVFFSKRQEHDLSVKNKEGKKAKPKNAVAFEVWRKVGGTPPQDDSDFTYVGTSTRSVYTIKYALSELGQTVWYRVRWINGKNEPGPWSEIISAIIA
jgi:hypothetical protein